MVRGGGEGGGERGEGERAFNSFYSESQYLVNKKKRGKQGFSFVT